MDSHLFRIQIRLGDSRIVELSEGKTNAEKNLRFSRLFVVDCRVVVLKIV